MSMLYAIHFLLPLVPLIVIFFRNAWRNRSLQFLAAICITQFVPSVLRVIPGITAHDQTVIANLSLLIELVLLFCLFIPLASVPVRRVIVVVFVGLFSAILTFSITANFPTSSEDLIVLCYWLIILIAGFALVMLIPLEDLQIFKSPQFWIATGTLFFSLLALLLTSLAKATDPDAMAMLYVVGAVRYLAYTYAAIQNDESH